MTNHPYQALGGRTKCLELSRAFYARVARDPLLRPLFPGKTFTCAIEEFSAFLAQFLGGPAEDSQRRWWLSLRESHLRFRIGPAERDAWMGHMVQALDDANIQEPMRGALLGLFDGSSAYVVNHGECLATKDMSDDMARRWAAQRILDDAVAAIRAGDVDRAIVLSRNGPRDPSVQAALLALMIDLAPYYVQEELTALPELAQARFSGRTLLHAAAGRGNLEIVEHLLNLGANPDVHTDGGHTPLYCVANECSKPTGAEIVRLLVARGAKVDACDGVMRCTALHMAARRDHIQVAEALLECGANIEARDKKGYTPLRRAVNCKQPGVAALLLAKGAKPLGEPQ